MKKNIKIDKLNYFVSSHFFGVSFFLFSLFCSNQFISQLPSFKSFQNVISTEPTFLIKADFKHSFVSNQLIAMRGVKVGLNYSDTFKVGIGYSWMKNNFIFDNPNVIVNNDNYDLKYSYLAFFFDYSFYKHNQWSYIISSDFAIAKFAYKNRSSNKIDYSSFGLVLEPSIAAEYRTLKYVILGGGIGYRFVLRNKNNVTENFSAPLFILRIKLDFLKLYKDYFKI